MCVKAGSLYDATHALRGVKLTCVCRNRLGFYSCLSCVHVLRCIVNQDYASDFSTVCVCVCVCVLTVVTACLPSVFGPLHLIVTLCSGRGLFDIIAQTAQTYSGLHTVPN